MIKTIKMMNLLKCLFLLTLLCFVGTNVMGQCCTNCPQLATDNGVTNYPFNFYDESATTGNECDSALNPVTQVDVKVIVTDLSQTNITITSPCGNTATLMGPGLGTGPCVLVGTGPFPIAFVDGSTSVYDSESNCNDPNLFTPGSVTFNPHMGTIAGLNCPGTGNCGVWTLTYTDAATGEVGNVLDFDIITTPGDGTVGQASCTEPPAPACSADNGTWGTP